MQAKHYVYEWVRPDLNVVFYVGKGVKGRAHDFVHNRNKHTKRIIEKLSKNNLKPCVRILARFTQKDSAFDFEKERIAFWMPLGELTNKTPGGEGGDTMSGRKHSPESIANMSAAQKGKKKNYDVWTKGKPMPEERKLQLISINTGNKYFFGRRHTEEAKAKISLAAIGRASPTKGKKMSDVSRKKMSEAKIGKKPFHLMRKVINVLENKIFEFGIFRIGISFLKYISLCMMY
jgi:hypothetical protein